MKIFGIVYLKNFTKESIIQDEIRLRNSNLDIGECRFIIPVVKILKNVIYYKETYEYKPLLFRYGFVELPIEYATNFEKLQLIVNLSYTLAGFVFRSKSALKQEILKNEGLGEHSPSILIETISQEEINRLFIIAQNLNIYNITDELAIGNYIILKGYPFDNIAAEIISKYTKTIKVKILSTGYEVQIQKENLYYTPYQDYESNPKEICFTELGYIPEV